MRRPAPIGTLALLLGAAACSSLLGIEDVHEGPAPGTSGGESGEANAGTSNAGASNPNGGSSAAAGASHAGASGGGAAHAGASNGGSGNPHAGDGQVEDAGAAGALGASGAPATSGPVSGHVIDFWGHPLANAAVQVAGKSTSTNASGAFSVDDVPAEYDASFVVQFADGATQTHVYLYQGLTRRDPTLQALQGTATVYSTIDVTFPGASTLLTGSRTMSFALGGKDISAEASEVDASGKSPPLKWWGPATTTAIAHALIWQNNAAELPESFQSYATANVSLVGDMPAHAMATLTMTAQTIASGTITGTVTPANFGDRGNSVVLRFGSGAAIRLALDFPKLDTFTYTVPSISGATVSIAAYEGCAGLGSGCALVHQDGLAASAVPLTFTIPKPAAALTTTPSGNTTADTVYSFTSSAPSTQPFLSIFSHSLGSDRLFLISTQRSFKIPKAINGSYSFDAGGAYLWSVESHGSPPSVDDMAGSSGFVDPYAYSPLDIEPKGARSGNGSYTSSLRKAFTVAN